VHDEAIKIKWIVMWHVYLPVSFNGKVGVFTKKKLVFTQWVTKFIRKNLKITIF